MAGFYPFRKQGSETSGEVRDFIIKNSTTLTLGMAVRVNSGFALTSGAGNRVMGVVVAFVRDIGQGSPIALGADAASGFTGTRTGNAGNIGSDTYAASATNQTVDKVMARVVIDPSMEYFNDASAALTTAMVGNYFDLVSASDQVDQATNTATYSAQVICLGLDPFNDGVATKGIFKIVESQLQ